MNFQELLKNKGVLIGIIVGAVVLILIVVIVIVMVASGGGGGGKDGGEKIKKEVTIKEPLDLLTTDNLGKAIEIQALLAREGINAQRRTEGSKSTIFLAEYKMSERDRALLAIVKSGLMDHNVGLEVFDKGDFTSTKEDKRIRLIRAVNGELSRLIRKIPPIENASVFISIPEQSMFASMQKPTTATVQLTIPSGERLDKSKVKAITNLLLGSVAGLTHDNVSITDTNGNVYTTIESADDNRLAKIEENDKYMQSKVQAQLDRLLGKGNYVVTVSTSLREVPIERQSITYDPVNKAATSEQVFQEGLGDQSRDSSSGINAVSLYVPNGLPQGSSGSSASQNRNYSRVAKETQYGVSKTQTNEYIKSGVVEEISIAVTVEEGRIPPTLTLDEFKQLIADAASPKVKVENVTIAFSDPVDPYLVQDKPTTLPVPDESGNPWWLAIVILVCGLVGGLGILSSIISKSSKEQEEQMKMLNQWTQQQEAIMQGFGNETRELKAKQEQLEKENLKLKEEHEKALAQIPQQMNMVQTGGGGATSPQQSIANNQVTMEDVLNDITSGLLDTNDDELEENIKSWIEK